MKSLRKKKKIRENNIHKVHLRKAVLLDFVLNRPLILVETTVKNKKGLLKSGWYWVERDNAERKDLVLGQNAWPIGSISFFMDQDMKDALIKK